MPSLEWTRKVGVAPTRLPGWLDGFAERHQQPTVELLSDSLLPLAPDGAAARFDLPWGPLPGVEPQAELIAAFQQPRRIGAFILRRKAHAVGVFQGEQLLTHKLGRHYVQGQTKAGGWSQQRYARRRSNQADRAFDAAAVDVAALLLPEATRLEALLQLGDRLSITKVLARSELAELNRAELDRGLPNFSVPDPNLKVLSGLPSQFRKVSIWLNERA